MARTRSIRGCINAGSVMTSIRTVYGSPLALVLVVEELTLARVSARSLTPETLADSVKGGSDFRTEESAFLSKPYYLSGTAASRPRSFPKSVLYVVSRGETHFTFGADKGPRSEFAWVLGGVWGRQLPTRAFPCGLPLQGCLSGSQGWYLGHHTDPQPFGAYSSHVQFRPPPRRGPGHFANGNINREVFETPGWTPSAALVGSGGGTRRAGGPRGVTSRRILSNHCRPQA